MKKSEWLTCTDPEPMLEFLWGKEYERNLRKSRERKMRLFAIACVLPLLHRISHEPGLEAVEVSERFADHDQASYTATWAAEVGIYAFDANQRDLHRREEGRRHCGLLRDIFGPLLFRKVSIPSSILAWNDRCVVNLATGIHVDRAFDRLPVLGDALEDAGCTDADVLSHCRQPGEHVLGCWVVDLCLGKM
jgi:hypothetical protein